jgi:hypothetical protein
MIDTRWIGVLIITVAVVVSPVVAVTAIPADPTSLTDEPTTNGGDADPGEEAGSPLSGGDTTWAKLTPADTSLVDIAPAELPGNGTADDPYVITNASELQAMEDDLDARYRLGADINASDTVRWNNGDGFDPIGNNSQRFSGTLDGAGYTITGLHINRSTTDSVGLFGSVADSGRISNVMLSEVVVSGSYRVGGLVGFNNGTVRGVSLTGAVNGSETVGGIVGDNHGTVREASATGDVNGTTFVGGLVGFNGFGGTVRDASATGTVSGLLWVGGFAGFNGFGGTISNASATGTVNGSSQVGGLIGKNRESTVRNVSATGTVNATSSVGGLVGSNKEGMISNASATGAVTGSEKVGGLVGTNGPGTIRNAFATGAVNGSYQVGGLVGIFNDPVNDSYWDVNTTGQSTSSSGTGLTTAQMTGDAARTYMTGFDFGSVWETQPDDYPVLTALATSSSETPTFRYAGGSVTPPIVNESATVEHDIGTVFTNVSQDGDTDRFYVTFPDAVAGGNLSADSANVTTLAGGSDVSISSSIIKIDGPDEDGVMDTLTFAVSPDASGTIDVVANVSVTVSWPAVDTDTTYMIKVAAEDSRTGNVSLRSIADVTVTSDTICVNRAVAGPDGEISLSEIQTAINWWAEDTEVPETGGQTISLTKIQTLINAWAEDQTVSCQG